MKTALPTSLVLALACSLPATTATSTAAATRHASYRMEVLVDGRPLPELPHAGRTYVEALRGREYAVRLANNTGERIAVALAVDGLNVIDARHTSAREARKWILGPWETIVLEGWQTSGATARRFVFTDERRSYGSWLGRTDDLGVISAAFFRERHPAYSLHGDMVRPPEAGASAPSAAQRDAGAGRDSAAARDSAVRKSEEPEERAATGIGREVDHRVREVPFDEEDAPVAVVDLRYEYREALLSLGVLPRPDRDQGMARRERARGFTDGRWAPDPYAGR